MENKEQATEEVKAADTNAENTEAKQDNAAEQKEAPKEEVVEAKTEEAPQAAETPEAAKEEKAPAKESLEFDGQNIVAPKLDYPEFKAGDTITVNYKIIEGDKQRIQAFKGDVIQRKGSGISQTFTVRKVSNGIGVERIFPLYSPNIDSIQVNKSGSVRRARIFYLRELKGKKARIKEKRR